MAHSLLFGERSLTKMAAVFGQAQEARAAAEHVMQDAHLPSAQVKVIGPNDAALEPKLEPEEPGIVHTLIRSHTTLGITGFVIGLLVASGLILAGVPFAVSSPYYTVIVTAVFGAVGGMMTGGLVSIRPDHDILITKVEEAVHEGHWAVVVHPRNHGQEERARDVLEHSGGEVVKTL